jgi:ribosome maturation factor RimP
MSASTDRVTRCVEPVCAGLGIDLYDVENHGSNVRILIDRPGGLDLDLITEASREISAALDREEPIAGSYTLEVSSPGVERPLRRPEHFAAVVGEQVKVKLRPGVEGDRRADGELVSVDGQSVTVRTEAGDRTLVIADITKAHTVFDWEAGIKKAGSGKNTASAGKNSAKTNKKSTTKNKETDTKPQAEPGATTESNEVTP